ncbi:MAG: GNAT family N-acetyltransferase [Pseudomonadota bacterium]
MMLAHEIPARGPSVATAEAIRAQIPVLETERLTLRAPRIEDFQGYAEIMEQPSAAYMLDAPDRESAWLDFCQLTATWALRGHGAWAVDFDGDLAGFVLLGFEPGDLEPELGYMLRPAFQGKGLAREAAEAARTYAFRQLNFTTLVSTIDPRNAASIQLAERLGGTRDALSEEQLGDGTLVYRYLNTEAVA